MRSLKLTLAYDGTAYAGWQVQPNARTIQETLEQVLRKITGQPVRTIASGRTDAGVHAAGQVVSLRTESELATDVLQRALNAELPHDIAVLSVAEASPDFHAIRDAVNKRYRYTIHDGPVRDVFRRHRVWHLFTRLDHQAMQRAAQPLEGTHDFASFQSSGADRESTIRTIAELAVVRRAGEAQDLVTIYVEADGFLYNMVRAIVGTLVEVGRGAQPETWPAEALQARDRSQAGPTAPPQGLTLVRVNYENDE